MPISLRGTSVIILMVALCVSFLAPSDSEATLSRLPDGLDLVLDPETGSRNLPTLALGQTFQVHAMVRELTGYGVGAFQIGLDVDPRLTVVDLELHPNEGLAITLTDVDILIGLSETLLWNQGPHVLATWTLRRDVEGSASEPLFVRMRDLIEQGPSGYISHVAPLHRGEFISTGDLRVGSVEPRIVRFMAGPPVAVEGRDYLLEWETEGAIEVRVDGEVVDASGSVTLEATVDRQHQIEVDTAGGTLQATTGVEVIREPRIVYLEGLPTNPTVPPVYQVRWKAVGAEIAWVSGEPKSVSPEGTVGRVAPGPTAVTLRAENEWGEARQALVLESDGTPIIALFEAGDETLDAGSSTQLFWSVVDADEVVLQPLGITVDNDGWMEVQPNDTTTYTLEATRNGDTVTAEVTIEVVPIRIVTFRAVPSSVYKGEPCLLQWEVVNAEEVWIEPDVGNVSITTGEAEVVPVTHNALYTLYARKGTEVISRELRIPLRVPYLSAYLTSYVPRDSLRLETVVRGANTLTIEPVPGSVQPVNGTNTHFIPGDRARTFTISAANEVGTTLEYIYYNPSVPYLQMQRTTYGSLAPGQKVQYRVYYRRAAELTLEYSPSGVVDVFDYNFLNSQSNNVYGLRLHEWIDEDITIDGTATNVIGDETDRLQLFASTSDRLTSSLSAYEIQLGSSALLEWQSLVGQPDSVVVEPLGHKWTGQSAGSLTVSPPESGQYRVVAYMSDGKAYRDLLDYEVTNDGVALSANPPIPRAGTIYELEIKMPVDATSAWLEPGFGSIPPQSQSLELTADAEMDFELRVTLPVGDRTATLHLNPETRSYELVSTLVDAIGIEAKAQGSDIDLEWNLVAATQPERLEIWRAAGEEPFHPHLTLGTDRGSITDSSVPTGIDLRYKLVAVIEGSTHESDVVRARAQVIPKSRMLSNIPNPFNPSTTLRWELARGGRYQLEIFDLRGRRVRMVDLGEQRVGTGSWVWDATDDKGRRVSSGVYLTRIAGDRVRLSRKVILVE